MHTRVCAADVQINMCMLVMYAHVCVQFVHCDTTIYIFHTAQSCKAVRVASPEENVAGQDGYDAIAITVAHRSRDVLNRLLLDATVCRGIQCEEGMGGNAAAIIVSASRRSSFGCCSRAGTKHLPLLFTSTLHRPPLSRGEICGSNSSSSHWSHRSGHAKVWLWSRQTAGAGTLSPAGKEGAVVARVHRQGEVQCCLPVVLLLLASMLWVVPSV